MAGIPLSRSHPPLSEYNPFRDPNCSETEGRMICCQENGEGCSGYTGKFTKRDGECETTYEFQNGSSQRAFEVDSVTSTATNKSQRYIQ